ncbi:response regulator transcription factor [Candidatus Synechococcus calcipolaris G9]|uniref:Response regulator transcription factor n=1 Tax=Candidatus Synechococcus calcipolaris G9 TaxID=1497997 RepID=A0ABT6EWS7_9SYNE|nr:response regulator transcription factor [Candidatus Synechococcus calcipolaris]MDG2990224.1 response regulator transcription factor [Candidatus Synechococcus calcipolaris G9]
MALTLLIADDEPGIRLSVSGYLESMGYFCLTAADGSEALEMIRRYQPHLLVTDIAMPQMNGFELVRQVRQQPALRLLPVIYLTARTQVEERIQAYQMGADSYLSKPFHLEELAAVVRNLLERSQLIQSQQSQWHQRPQEHPSTVSTDYPALELTERERQVLNLLAEGLSNAQIGDRLHLSARTIEKYVSNLLQKAQAHNRAELVRLAIEQHLLSPSSESN